MTRYPTRSTAVPVTLLVGLALLLGVVAGPAVAAAQEATPAPSRSAVDLGVVDAASRSLWNTEDPAAPVYLFTVLEFSDEAKAEAAFAQVTDENAGLLGDTGTPEAQASIVASLDREDVDLADEAVRYYQPDETGAAGIATLFVRDGVYLHQWSTLPVPLQENALLVDPATLIAALDDIAGAWFDSDHEGDALAQLPGLGEVGEGYSVLDESSGTEGLAPIFDGGTPTPAA